MKLPAFKVESERLLIRSYVISDAKELNRLVNQECESLKDYFPMTVERNKTIYDSEEFIRQRNEETLQGKSVFAGIFEKETNKLIGQIAVKEINWRVPKCELGYFIASPERGKKLAPEALNAVAEFCFRKAGMVKLLLRIEHTNRSSIRVAEKCGFTLSGTLRNDFRATDGRLMDCEVWERICE